MIYLSSVVYLALFPKNATIVSIDFNYFIFF